jgi:arylsulfatase A-like enzyme
VYGGYLDAQGAPSPSLLNAIEFVDLSIGNMIQALKNTGAFDSTLIILTAKDGQNPIDSSRYLGITNSPDDPITTSPATVAANSGCLPYSESPLNPTSLGPTEDDISLVWLKSSCTARKRGGHVGDAIALNQRYRRHRGDFLGGRHDPALQHAWPATQW